MKMVPCYILSSLSLSVVRTAPAPSFLALKGGQANSRGWQAQCIAHQVPHQHVWAQALVDSAATQNKRMGQISYETMVWQFMNKSEGNETK